MTPIRLVAALGLTVLAAAAAASKPARAAAPPSAP